MSHPSNRRNTLRLLAGLPLLWAVPAIANAARIGRLIEEAHALPHASQRIDFISRLLLGTRYQADTLIGGPRKPEQFVVREDAFDCVTFCEVVLAAAIVPRPDEFETALRRIRYDHGRVQWDQRNHYFADWCHRNTESGICTPVAMKPSIAVDKTVSSQRGLGQRRVSMTTVPTAAFLQQANLLAAGDIVGFTSRRPNLDYFHTGLIAFGKDRSLLLRHASQSRGRVIDERMTAFVAVNRVKSVTVLRASENAPIAEGH